jgi:hypothetical protein
MESFAMVISTLVAQPHRELPVPSYVIGIIAFVLLSVLLLVTLAIGKGRPHS